MSPGGRPAWPPLLRAVLYAAGLVALADVLLLRIDTDDAWHLFGEHGRLETVQVALLAVHAGLAAWIGRRRPAARALAVLLCGLAAAAVVREHNNWFKDHVADGAWQAVVGLVLLVTVVVAWRTPGRLRDGLADLVRGPGFGWLAAGLVVFLYGQVLDERPIWDLLLDGDVPYAAQRMAEECAETAAYWLIAAGLLEWGLTPRAPAAEPA